MSGNVAQSGRVSAAGMCIESVWRSVPLTFISGSNYGIGIAATNPHRFVKFDSGLGFPPKPDILVADDEIDGDAETHRTILQGKDYKGAFPFKVDPENLYYYLLGILGRDQQATVASGAYSHIMKPHKKAYAPSFTVEEILGDGSSGRVSSGCQVQKLEIQLAKTLMARADMYAYRQIPNQYPNSSGTDTVYDFGSTPAVLPSQLGGDWTKEIACTLSPTYCDVSEIQDGDGPLVFAGMTNGSQTGFGNTFLKVDGSDVAVKILPSSSIYFEKGIEEGQSGGSGMDAGYCVHNNVMAGGKFDILFLDNTIPKAVLQHAKMALNFKINGALIGSSGIKYGLEVYYPWLTMLDSGPVVETKKLMTGGNFRAKVDPTAGCSVVVILTNSFDNTSLAGTVASLPGGAGGWLNS